MKRGSTLTLMAAIAMIPILSFAQAPAIEWQNSIGGNKTDILYSLQQTSNGGYIAGGSSNSGVKGDKTENSRGGFDYWVTRLDQYGNVVWDKTVGGSKLDYLGCVKPTSDGGYILGGESTSGISGDKTEACYGNYDYWVVKLDGNGNKVWDKTLGGSKKEYLYSLQPTSDGGYILGGYSESNASGNKTENSRGLNDYWIVKLNSSGGIVWDKTIGGNRDEYLRSIVQTGDGGYLLGGSSGSAISGEKTQDQVGMLDYWIVKLNSSGTVMWDKTIGGDGMDYCHSISKVIGGGFILGGYSTSNISGNKTEACRGDYDYWAVKIDQNGNVLWDKTVGGDDEDELNSIGQTSDGGFVLGGYSESNISGDKTQNGLGYYDYWVVRLDQNGNFVWDKNIGTTGDDELYSFQQTSDGGYIVGGYTDAGISGDKTEASNGFQDYWVMKLAGGSPKLDNQVNTSSDKDPHFIDAMIDPNPSAGVFSIVIHEPLQQEAMITVLNSLGETIYSQQFSAVDMESAQTISLGNKIPAGIYFLKIASGDQVMTRQIVLEH